MPRTRLSALFATASMTRTSLGLRAIGSGIEHVFDPARVEPFA
jgi:hypothetical protein